MEYFRKTGTLIHIHVFYILYYAIYNPELLAASVVICCLLTRKL